MRSRPQEPDRGSGTVLAVGVVAALATLLVAALLLAGVLVAGQRARTAADLAALAAAGQVVEGRGQLAACGAAASVAAANGGALTGCDALPGGTQPWPEVRVTVTSAVAATPWTATARAVAGARTREG